ncbi:MAG TPA: XRE family transcriptional regulator [Telluria sp.]
MNDVINSLPAERQTAIAAASQKKIEDMLAHAATLTDFRKAIGKTQAEVAKDLGINQNAVSQLEQRSDTYVSTLRRFLKSLGLTLELSVIDKNGVRIDLPNFFQPNTDPSANPPGPFPSAREPARKTAAKRASASQMAAETSPARKAANPVEASGAAKKRLPPRAKVRARL